MEHTSEFDTKVKKACQKKEALFTESKGRYAIPFNVCRSILNDEYSGRGICSTKYCKH